MLLTRDEKEKIFIDALQSFYFSGRKTLSDTEFDQLKEDLAWEGSEVVTLNRDETKFLAAMSAYLKGEPIMSDEEFDALKASLKEAGSSVAVSTEPKCFVDTGICTVNFTEDKTRMASIYLIPNGVIFGLFWLGLLYEIVEPLRYVNPVVLLFVAGFPAYASTVFFTENIFLKKPLIAKGPCPACGTENRIFFGDIVGVEGFKNDAEFNCSNCKTPISIRRSDLRARTSPKDLA